MSARWIKPGTDVISVQSADSKATYPWDQAWTGTKYALDPGASMSCPLTAGMVADFYQFYNMTHSKLPSPALAKAAMINGSVTMGSYGHPSNTQGWGRVNLVNTIDGPTGGSVVFVNQDEVTPLITGASWTQNFSVNNSSIPLKVTLLLEGI